MTSDLFYIQGAPRGTLPGLGEAGTAGAAGAWPLSALREAGIAAAAWTRRARRRRAKPLPSARVLLRSIAKAAREADDNAKTCLLDGLRLIRSAAKGLDELNRFLRRCPVVETAFGVEMPRLCMVARDYLRVTGGKYSDAEFADFLHGYQEAAELETGEIDRLRPALQFAILERLSVTPASAWPDLVTSLRRVEETSWRDLSESVSVIDSVLRRDPTGVYAAMDFESREAYRRAVVRLAHRSGRSELEIAESAVALAEEAARPARVVGRTEAGETACATAAAACPAGETRRAHVGYYLVDRGVRELRAAVGYRLSFAERICEFMIANPVLYPAVIEALTFVIVAALVSGMGTPGVMLASVLLLVLPASQAALDFLNHLVALIVRPRTLPKLDFSRGIPDDCATMVAVPALLLNENQVGDLVFDLEIRFLANRDRNLSFALLTDAADSDRAMDERDALAEVCRDLIETLNQKYRFEGRTPFYLFHRNRMYNPSEGRWIGWERKRGKLLDLNRLLRGAQNGFSLTVGDLDVLPNVRYVITLDADTQLPRDSAARLAGAIAHPLNRAVVDPATGVVTEGYGILQPRVGISVQSAARSRLAAIYSGETGFDIYTRAISEAYQDLFGEGIYTGKGIYDVDVLHEVLEDRFPENALLSHDLIEGAYARAALVSDIELIDDYPSHFSAYSRRKHRWVRGDWQILRWLFGTVPDAQQRIVRNPIGVLSQWKIVDNLRRSVLEPSMLLLFLAGWLWLPANAWLWTATAIAVLLLPALVDPPFSLLRAPAGWRMFSEWLKDTAKRFVTNTIRNLLSLTFLLHQALLSIDAIVRSLLRVNFTKRKLLEWETAAEAEIAPARRKATVDKYLEWTPWLSIAIGVAVWLVRPAALHAALPVLALWFASRGISAWLNRAPRAVTREFRAEDLYLLRESAQRVCRFYDDWSGPATNWLIPDSVKEDGTADLRLSPTNLGMLLNARVAAVHLGTLSLSEFVAQSKKTLESAERLEKHRGHWLNWYSIERMAPIEPRFVSSVDSGNLAACLWTLKQAALSFAAEPVAQRGLTPALIAELEEIAGTCERWVREMDFSFLYQPGKRALSIGYDVTAGRLEAASYDLLASEARIATFVAIAKGDVPQDAWLYLGRTHTLVRGECALLSWTGTMFEYLMPLLWMRHRPGTIAERSAAAAVRLQRDYARRKDLPWGISECAFFQGSGRDYGYAAFGIPDLALKRYETDPKVIAPYATFLALGVDPAEALANLRCQQELGWLGRYGFYEAVDCSPSAPEPIRSWMAHHQGMSLLAACNLLHESPMQCHFHAEPQVIATELLLDERVPRASMAETTNHDAPIEDALEEMAA